MTECQGSRVTHLFSRWPFECRTADGVVHQEAKALLLEGIVILLSSYESVFLAERNKYIPHENQKKSHMNSYKSNAPKPQVLSLSRLLKTLCIPISVLLGASAHATNNVGPDAAPYAFVTTVGNATVAVNGSTTIRAWAFDTNGQNGTNISIHIDITKLDNSTVAFAYYSASGGAADTSDWTVGGGAQGFNLSSTGTYTVKVKAADYSQGYERWGSTAQVQINVVSSVSSNTYYFSTSGSEHNQDGKSSNDPWSSLSHISSLQAGDTALLKRGDSWQLSSDLVLPTTATVNARITIADYSSGALPVVSRNASPSPSSGYCFSIVDGGYITFRNIKFTNALNGVYIAANTNGTVNYGMEFQNCTFKDMNYYYTGGGQPSGAAISIQPLHEVVADVGIVGCTFDTCWIGAYVSGTQQSWGAHYVTIRDCNSTSCGLWDIGVIGGTNIVIQNSDNYNTGKNVSNHPGSASIYIDGATDVFVVSSTIDTVNHYGYQSDGMGICIENTVAVSDYIVVSNCTVKNTQGPGVCWLGGGACGYYNVVENSTFDNCNTTDNSWISLITGQGLTTTQARAFARATFVSFNDESQETVGGAFVNNTRTNIPSGNTGRYCADTAWGGATRGFAFTASGYSASGASN